MCVLAHEPPRHDRDRLPLSASLRRPVAAPAAALAFLVSVFLSVALSGLVAAPAQAHDSLIASSPSEGEVLTENPGAAVLTYSADIQEIGTAIEIVGPDGDVAGAPEISGREVVVPIAADAAAGEYLITWRVTSSDGHPIDGEIPFTMDLPEEAATTPEPSAETSTAEETQEATSAAPSPTEVSASSEASADSDSAADETAVPDVSDLPAWVIALIAVAIVGAVVALLVRMRRSSRFRE